MNSKAGVVIISVLSMFSNVIQQATVYYFGNYLTERVTDTNGLFNLIFKFTK